MPSCEAFPEETGQYELDDCEENREGDAIYVSYATRDDGELFYIDALDVGAELGVEGMDDWSLDCTAWDTRTDERWECEFGSASYESFTEDEVIGEIRSLATSIDDDMLDEFREDRHRLGR